MTDYLCWTVRKETVGGFHSMPVILSVSSSHFLCRGTAWLLFPSAEMLASLSLSSFIQLRVVPHWEPSPSPSRSLFPLLLPVISGHPSPSATNSWPSVHILLSLALFPLPPVLPLTDLSLSPFSIPLYMLQSLWGVMLDSDYSGRITVLLKQSVHFSALSHAWQLCNAWVAPAALLPTEKALCGSYTVIFCFTWQSKRLLKQQLNVV